jgi:hypothetical protein
LDPVTGEKGVERSIFCRAVEEEIVRCQLREERVAGGVRESRDNRRIADARLRYMNRERDDETLMQRIGSVWTSIRRTPCVKVGILTVITAGALYTVCNIGIDEYCFLFTSASFWIAVVLQRHLLPRVGLSSRQAKCGSNPEDSL